jgi:hypothetical protein
MKQKYLFVALTEIEYPSLDEPADPLLQNNTATYLHAALTDGLEDANDTVIDSRVYALGPCLGRDNEAHEHGVKRGDVEWCSTCGAIKIGDGPWQLPDIRIDRKE